MPEKELGSFSSARKMRNSGSEALIVAAIPVLVWLLYSPMRSLSWTYDDFFHLHYLSTHHFVTILFDPNNWREMPFRMFTPALFLSLDFDRLLWGVRPTPFYWHQLATICLGDIALYFTARLWFSRLFAATTVVLFLLGVPICGTAPLLMKRHYLDGFAAAAIATFLFVWAVRTGRRGWAVLSAVAYFAAMTAKEIYVPCILLFALLPDSTLRLRARALLPQLVALCTYLVWRFVMLGTLLGGYGWAVEPSQRPRLLVLLPYRVFTTFLGTGFWFGLLACVLMSAIAIAWVIRRRKVATILAVGTLTILPFAAVASVTEACFGILPWLLLVVSFVGGCSALWDKGARVATGALIGAVVILLTIANRSDWATTYASLARMSTEANAFRTLTRRDVLAHPTIPPAAMGELAWLNEHVLGGSGNGDWYYDDIYLCEHLDDARRIWTFDHATGTVRDLSGDREKRRAASCSSVSSNRPLVVELHSKRHDLFWSFGPYRDGAYQLVLDDGRGAYEVPRSAGYQLGTLPALSFRVKYTSPQGWATYSPVLTIAIDRDGRLRWARPEVAPTTLSK